MGEQLISFETAKLAKEKGFNGFYHAFYYDKDGNEWMGFSSNSKDYDDKYVKSSQSLLQKWLRKEHKLIVIVGYQYEHDSTPYQFWIYKDGDSLPINEWVYDYNTYEEALEIGLLEALKLI